MSHQRWHFWEKVQVEIAMVAGFLLAYFALWTLVRPWAQGEPVVYLWGPGPMAGAAAGRLVLLALVTWALAAACAAMTLSARPEGSLLATLVGIAAFGVRSGGMDDLLRYTDRVGALMAAMVLELAILAVILAGAFGVVYLVRAVAARVRPGWVRPAGLPSAPAVKAPTGNGSLLAGGSEPVQTAGTFVVTLAVASILMILLLRGSQRGQVIFALASSFFVAAVVARYVFPSRLSVGCWLAPVAMGLFVYARAAMAAPEPGPLAWARVLSASWVAALPIDWFTAGCGGAIGGYWLACRIHGAAHLPKPVTEPAEE